MKLNASPTSPFSRKVRVVLAEKHIDYDFVVARSQLAQALPEPRQAVRKLLQRAPFKDTAPPQAKR